MKKKKIAVYIRIPKNSANKLQIICDEYRSKIADRKDCQLVEIYHDVGLSGVDNNRPGYLKMLQAARNKEFDYIVTKHHGKLSRRPIDLQKIIKELRQIGVGIYFEDGEVDTLQINYPCDDILSLQTKVRKY